MGLCRRKNLRITKKHVYKFSSRSPNIWLSANFLKLTKMFHPICANPERFSILFTEIRFIFIMCYMYFLAK